jgi:hypothetical protein
MALIITAFIMAEAANAEDPQPQPQPEPQPIYEVNHSSVTFNSYYNEPWKALWISKIDVEPNQYISMTRYSCPMNGSIVSLSPKAWTNGLVPVYVRPLKAGKTTITVTTPDNKTIDVPVTVDKSYFRAALAANPYFSISDDEEEFNNKLLYGQKKYYGSDAVPFTKITVKCGKKKIKTKADAQGNFKFKLKQEYKIGTKGWIKYKSNGVTFTDKLKVSKWSKISHKPGFCKSSGGKTKIGFKVKNLHKGDIIKVAVKNKVYTQVIKNPKVKTVYVQAGKAKRSTMFKVTLLNKYLQKMVVKDLYV